MVVCGHNVRVEVTGINYYYLSMLPIAVRYCKVILYSIMSNLALGINLVVVLMMNQNYGLLCFKPHLNHISFTINLIYIISLSPHLLVYIFLLFINIFFFHATESLIITLQGVKVKKAKRRQQHQASVLGRQTGMV